ncbi:hypothetical protein B0675_36470 [Streptomyces sp. M41(2017)]|uniref:hypothetical protein n=1 Tax=Streptomyces sp. M41(2017) TaxID=1955065 RepID=UPI0009BDFCBB|nr:hypothetical protein [Streptomyces sp. M41(2017)]OQQ12941.1 hypothetical protein B0675_39640 [Streptomyces sp. M41(2017)]OQQ15496.1 hypothetical protein B0675_36470 [Streptomyces sp. M41(2017)]
MDDEGRYRLTLTMGGRRTMRGWWATETAARKQIPVWVRDWGVEGAVITLTDTATGTVIHRWPDED